MKPNAMPPLDPLPNTRPSKAWKDRDFALYVDGRRVQTKAIAMLADDGVTVSVTFATSLGAIDSPEVDPDVEIAWGGWKAGDSCHLRQPAATKQPSNGYVQIQSVHPAKTTADATMFECIALSPVYDYDQDVYICQSGDRVLIPATWFQK